MCFTFLSSFFIYIINEKKLIIKSAIFITLKSFDIKSFQVALTNYNADHEKEIKKLKGNNTIMYDYTDTLDGSILLSDKKTIFVILSTSKRDELVNEIRKINPISIKDLNKESIDNVLG
jgi:nitrogenase molybdenum-iron protein alpha/beta subunit